MAFLGFNTMLSPFDESDKAKVKNTSAKKQTNKTKQKNKKKQQKTASQSKPTFSQKLPIIKSEMSYSNFFFSVCFIWNSNFYYKYAFYFVNQVRALSSLKKGFSTFWQWQKKFGNFCIEEIKGLPIFGQWCQLYFLLLAYIL